jgi:hypothetical protein
MPLGHPGQRSRSKPSPALPQYALQVLSHNVRNLLVDHLSLLLHMLHGDGEADDFPRGMRIKIGRHYAGTGEILSFEEVKREMLRQGESMLLTDAMNSPNGEARDEAEEEEEEDGNDSASSHGGGSSSSSGENSSMTKIEQSPQPQDRIVDDLNQDTQEAHMEHHDTS